MKKTGKIFKLLAAVMIIACFAAFFAACNNDKKGDTTEKTVTLVLDNTLSENGKVTAFKNVKTSGEFLADLLSEMQTAGKLTYVASGTGKDMFLEQVNDMKQDADFDPFIALYTDATGFSNNLYGAASYDGKDFDSAIAGIAMLPIEDGKTYIIKLT